MDAHVPRYAANVFGVMFAAVGFGLSIFALVLSSVVPQHQFAPEDFVYHSEKHIRRPQPGVKAADPPLLHRPRRLSSRDSQSSLSSSEGPSTPKDAQQISPKIRQSASPPSETETDYANDQRPYILRKPTSLTFSQLPTSSPESLRNSPPSTTKTVWVSSNVVPRKPSKLAGFASAWKEHEHKVPRQKMSSPHLTHVTPHFMTAAARMQFASSKVVPCKRLEKILMLRRCQSLPLASSRSPSKKKRSQPLRTQPYEAPYFAPLPQPVFIEKQEASISRRRRPHRSHTLDSLTRRSTSSSFQNSDTDVPPVPPLPPSFSRQQT